MLPQASRATLNDHMKSKEEKPEKETRRANPISQLLFNYVTPVVRRGRRERLEEKDLLRRRDLATDALHDRFSAAWEVERKKSKPWILNSVVSGTQGWLVLTGVLYTCSVLMQFVGPLMVHRIVAGLSCDHEKQEDCPSRKDLYLDACLLFVAPLLQSLAESHLFFQLNMYGTRLRNGLMAAIYR